jgi:hypothetical protein
MSRRLLLAVIACTGLAAASLPVAAEPVYDAWAWLVWGRELTDLRLDLTTGPSWKPLTVALAAALSPAGDAAPASWLVLVRTAWLLSFVLAAELAHHLTAGRPRALRIAAAAFAAAALVLLSDEVTLWGRQAAGGMSEPLLVALVLGAVRAALAGGARWALVLGGLAALLRPEAWPLLALYGAWCWRTQPRARPLVGALAIAVPALWFAPELLAEGGGGAERAQRDTSDPLEALGRAFVLPLTVAWPLALWALRARPARLLLAGALLWIAVVAAMTTIGFAGLPRFMAPAAALVCVLGGVGLADALASLAGRPRPRPRAAAVAGGLLVVLGAGVTAARLADRVSDVPQAWRVTARTEEAHDRLRWLVRHVGREQLLRCGNLATSDTLVRTALAWELDVALSRVVVFGTAPRASGAFVVGLGAPRELHDDVRSAGRLLGVSGEWRAYSIGCPVTTTSPPPRNAGVSGASR